MSFSIPTYIVRYLSTQENRMEVLRVPKTKLEDVLAVLIFNNVSEISCHLETQDDLVDYASTRIMPVVPS